MSGFSSLRSRFTEKRRQITQRIAANFGLAEAKEDPAFDRSAADFERGEQAAEALTKAFKRYVKALQELGAAQSDLTQQIVRWRCPASTSSGLGADSSDAAPAGEATAAASQSAAAQPQADASQSPGDAGHARRARSLPRVHVREGPAAAPAAPAPSAPEAQQPRAGDGSTGCLRPVRATPLEQPDMPQLCQRLDRAAKTYRLRVDAAVSSVWRRHVLQPLGKWMLWHDAVRARVAEKRKLLVDVRASERDLEFPPDSLDEAEVRRRRERLHSVQQRLDAVSTWLQVQFEARPRVSAALVDPAVAAFLSTALHVGRHATDLLAPLVAQLPLCAEARADLAVSAADACEKASPQAEDRGPPRVVMPMDVAGAAERQPLRLPSDSSFQVLHEFATLGHDAGVAPAPQAGPDAGPASASAAEAEEAGKSRGAGPSHTGEAPLCYARMAFAFAGSEADELRVEQGQAVEVVAASPQRTDVLVAAGASPREPCSEEGWARVRVASDGGGSRVGFVPEAYIDWDRSALYETGAAFAP